MSPAVERALRACLALVLAAFVAHLVANLGRVPLHGDTRSSIARAPEFSLANGVVTGPADVPGWVAMAEAGTADARRGPLYAPILRVVHDVVGGPWRAGLTPGEAGEKRDFVPWHAAVQVVQLALFGAAVFLLGRVLRLRGTPARLVWWGLALDPLVVHAQCSLMPDGLALSAVVLAFAALVVHARQGDLRALAGFAAAVSAAALLRPEKGVVFATAALAAAVVQWLVSTERTPRLRAASWPVAAALAALASAAVSRAVLDSDARRGWTMTEIAVHSRVAFPRLARLVPHLPDEWRARLPHEAVRRYDDDLSDARRLVDLLSEGSAERRAEITRVFFEAAREHAALDVVTAALVDVPPNLCPLGAGAFAFASWRIGGDAHVVTEPHESGIVAWRLLLKTAPLASGAALAALFTVVVSGCVVGAAAARSRSARRALAALAPSAPIAVFAGAFLLANAVAFAATQDLVDLRYGLPAHLVLVAGAWYALGLRCSPRASANDASAPSTPAT